MTSRRSRTRAAYALFAVAALALAACDDRPLPPSGSVLEGDSAVYWCDPERGVFDLSERALAQAICEEREYECLVCPQATDAKGAPRLWAARYLADTCGCPEPERATCESRPATSGLPERHLAESVCETASGDCTVCPHRVNGRDEPIAWAAIEMPAACGCPEPLRAPECESAGEDAVVCESAEACLEAECGGPHCMVCPERASGEIERWVAYPTSEDAGCRCPAIEPAG